MVDVLVSHDVEPPVELELLVSQVGIPYVEGSSLLTVEQLFDVEYLTGHQLLLVRLLSVCH